MFNKILLLDRGTPYQRYAVLGLWFVIGLTYFSFAGQWIATSMNDRALADYMRHVVRVAATENRPAKEVRQLMLVRAEQLELPVPPEAIRVVTEETRVRATVNYETAVNLPLVGRPVYRMAFAHDLRYDRPNSR
jgi:hypothetical protein